MNKGKNIVRKILLHAFILAAIVSGCVVNKNMQEQENTFAGLKLWENNCSRCHNSPNPASFSNAEWDVIGAHMRVRAYLTEKETNEITKFLKSIN